MERIRYPIENYSSRNKFKNYSSDYREKMDRVMGEVMDLVDDPKYLPFFFKRLNTLGPDKFLTLADVARKIGKAKGRYFVKLLTT